MADVKITIRKNGPYRIDAPQGSIELVDADGNAYDLSAKIKEGRLAFSLCRCGASVNKPFCDGTHSKIGFEAAEAAVRREGQGLPPIPGATSPTQTSGAPGQAAGDQTVPPPKPRTEM